MIFRPPGPSRKFSSDAPRGCGKLKRQKKPAHTGNLAKFITNLSAKSNSPARGQPGIGLTFETAPAKIDPEVNLYRMVNPKESDKRARKRAKARKSLMDHGLALMAQKGVHGCKVEDITAAAGLGKGTFFTHFESKDQFTALLLDAVLTDLARRVRPLKLTPTDADSIMSGVGAVHLRYFQLRPEAASLVCQACLLARESPAAGEVRTRLEEHVDFLADMLAPAAKALSWPGDRLRELGLMILSNSAGYFWFKASLDMPDAPGELLDRLGRVLARGLSGDKA